MGNLKVYTALPAYCLAILCLGRRARELPSSTMIQELCQPNRAPVALVRVVHGLFWALCLLSLDGAEQQQADHLCAPL